MKIKNIINIIKDIFIKACIYFTIVTLFFNILAWFLNQILNYGIYFMFFLASLGAGVFVQIFKVEKIPSSSRHILFFILLYLDFLLICVPLSKYTATQSTTLYLSVIFIVLYLVIFGIYAGIKAIINSVKNKKLKYDNQF